MINTPERLYIRRFLNRPPHHGTSSIVVDLSTWTTTDGGKRSGGTIRISDCSGTAIEIAVTGGGGDAEENTIAKLQALAHDVAYAASWMLARARERNAPDGAGGEHG